MSGTGIGPDRPVVVVGAGVYGLSLACRLAEAGLPVAVVERGAQAGGLAGGYRCGRVVHDIGPKRFHTDDADVEAFIRAVLAEDALGIGRESLVHFQGRYYRWPLGPRDIAQLPPGLVARTGFDLLTGRDRPAEVRTFRDYVLALYGPTLYRHFFADYSKKFLGLPPAETDADWASTGLQRAIIDRRLKLDSLRDMVVSAITPQGRPEPGFIYPRGGMDTFIRRLLERIRGLGARVSLGAGVTGVRLAPSGDRVEEVRTDDGPVTCGLLVWSGPLPLLCRLLGFEPPSLSYLRLHLYCTDVPAPSAPPFQWCYFGSPELVFSRISMPDRFDPGLALPGRTGLLLEVTEPEVQRRGGDPMALVPSLVADLRKVGLLGRGERTGPVVHHPIPDAYPIYRSGYREHVDAARARLTPIGNLRLGGRTGTFWYNNMDGSIAQALGHAREIARAA